MNIDNIFHVGLQLMKTLSLATGVTLRKKESSQHAFCEHQPTHNENMNMLMGYNVEHLSSATQHELINTMG